MSAKPKTGVNPRPSPNRSVALPLLEFRKNLCILSCLRQNPLGKQIEGEGLFSRLRVVRHFYKFVHFVQIGFCSEMGPLCVDILQIKKTLGDKLST